MDKKPNITPEAILRYVTGKASLEQMAQMTEALGGDPELGDLVGLVERMHENGQLTEESDIPMASMAALSEGNLCDVICEQYILKEYLGEKAFDDCVDQMLENSWLKTAGTPLHLMGRLLEKHGLSVSREYDCTMEALADMLSRRYKVIAVVDYGQLWNREADGIFHAVVCLNLHAGILRIYDPAIDGFSNYEADDFEKAWACSRHYLVYTSAEGLEYHPHPIDVSDVELDEQLLELSEAIAENVHEVWSKTRIGEGWTYGKKRDDERKQHPDLIPYSELPEGEKQYDRVMAFDTLRLVRKLGFDITRRPTRYCPCCGEFVADTFQFCPHCGKPLD